jgi:3-vinyl bacteriochlorophyllide hydratase
MGKPRHKSGRQGLYSAEERVRRDSSKWTVVQGVLAAFQFLVFLISLIFVLRTLATGEDAALANLSVIFKTVVLYTIMVTGALWEKEVFGQYLFAPAFFWEDAVSFIVIGLHTVYVYALLSGSLSQHGLMLLALSAYAVYALNATQFLLKLRQARTQIAEASA